VEWDDSVNYPERQVLAGPGWQSPSFGSPPALAAGAWPMTSDPRAFNDNRATKLA